MYCENTLCAKVELLKKFKNWNWGPALYRRRCLVKLAIAVVSVLIMYSKNVSEAAPASDKRCKITLQNWNSARYSCIMNTLQCRSFCVLLKYFRKYRLMQCITPISGHVCIIDQLHDYSPTKLLYSSRNDLKSFAEDFLPTPLISYLPWRLFFALCNPALQFYESMWRLVCVGPWGWCITFVIWYFQAKLHRVSYSILLDSSILLIAAALSVVFFITTSTCTNLSALHYIRQPWRLAYCTKW